MPEIFIEGIAVHFPFEPYSVQRDYMEKVIMCLRESSNGVLESPTGTGKTLSLLCSTLGWLRTRKTDVEFEKHVIKRQQKPPSTLADQVLNNELVAVLGKPTNWGVPKVIYASRTHSQLNQAMRELKRSAYGNMRAVVLGSRDQLCIHTDVMREQGNSNKVNMCKLKVHSKTCSFQLRVESKKDHPEFHGPPIMDIEDLVKVGQRLRMCPYYASKELVKDADITFMPYNYLLDPKARKANKIDLSNTIVILDEAHNIEKICEESASVQIRTSDVAMAIEDVTHIMKLFTSDNVDAATDDPKDFTMDDLTLLKEMLLELEKSFDGITVDDGVSQTFPANYMYKLLGDANFTYANCATIVGLLDKLVQYLMVASQQSTMMRKGNSFLVLSELLNIVFANKEEILSKVDVSFKVHVELEEGRQSKQPAAGKSSSGWLGKGNNATTSAKTAKIINFWCFNPGFGMEQLLNTNVRSVILTSGTLAPLKPLIAELAIPVAHFLENPHIVDENQVYVKIIGTGPDREQLISNYRNRDNPKYMRSLGSTILNVSRVVPDGLLVFFPSYPMMNACVDSWQASGLWADLSRRKPIFMEPRGKDQFTSTMEEFYQAIRDSKGAIFMAVCRGKVSEGLDFADRNGRAVIITGLPFPPMMDPKVMLKRRYLDCNRTKENELLTGQAWYTLEATRAVNQAIGRVIRHRHDYGAILLCDSRFQDAFQVQQLSKWVRTHLGSRPRNTPFGPVVHELRQFFRKAEELEMRPPLRTNDYLLNSVNLSEISSDPSEPHMEPPNMAVSRARMARNVLAQAEQVYSVTKWTPEEYARAAGSMSPTLKSTPGVMDFISRLNTNATTIDFNSSASGQVKIYKRTRTSPTPSETTSQINIRKRYKLVNPSEIKSDPEQASTSQLLQSQSQSKSQTEIKTEIQTDAKVSPEANSSKSVDESRVEFLRQVRGSISNDQFRSFGGALLAYKSGSYESFDRLMLVLLEALGTPELRHLLLMMRRFLKAEHKEEFDVRMASL
ncbi:hypothetical protein KR093_007325 [Drosophila rubida]|uniref:Regulator of telomere elongation helicase 1 homolog n=1 Tax=Drosophila rubida TaxID=30044 RepID=A0AAD4KC36_9MUSC|nr:hypothetical protein KR093_007325 [Drosophila rubida]